MFEQSHKFKLSVSVHDVTRSGALLVLLSFQMGQPAAPGLEHTDEDCKLSARGRRVRV